MKRKTTKDEKLEELLAHLKVQKNQFEITLTHQMEIIKEEEQAKRQDQLNMIADEQQIYNDLTFKLTEKTNEVKYLYGQVEALLMKKGMKDTKEIHELKRKLSSSKNECQKARAHLIEHKKENEKKTKKDQI